METIYLTPAKLEKLRQSKRFAAAESVFSQGFYNDDPEKNGIQFYYNGKKYVYSAPKEK